MAPSSVLDPYEAEERTGARCWLPEMESPEMFMMLIKSPTFHRVGAFQSLQTNDSVGAQPAINKLKRTQAQVELLFTFPPTDSRHKKRIKTMCTRE